VLNVALPPGTIMEEVEEVETKEVEKVEAEEVEEVEAELLDDSCAPAGLLPATSGLFSVLNPASGHRERILLQPRACTDPELVLQAVRRPLFPGDSEII
jgi:hypothetical protein